MYTRVYQGGKRELPEEYHGTAFQSEEICEEAPEEDVSPIEHTPYEDRGAHSPEPERDAGEGRKEEAGKKGDAQEGAWRAELLLLALCALLIESDEPDTRLLAILLLLCLSPNT